MENKAVPKLSRPPHIPSSRKKPALWLSLRFPQLPLDHVDEDGKALVVADGSRVKLVNAEAETLGIKPGNSIHTALLLSHSETEQNSSDNLAIVSYCPEQEQQHLWQLAQWAYQFTPYVSLWRQHQSLLLELSSCLSLFGGLDALLKKIHDALEQRHLTAISSLAHTPKAAWVLGWQPECNPLKKDGQLKNEFHNKTLTEVPFLQYLTLMPLAALPDFAPFTEKLLLRLHNVGFVNLGELLNLPRNSIAKRYGHDCLKQLDQITGQAPDLQTYIAPCEEFSSERHYLRGLENTATLLPPVQDLLREFQIFLRARQLQAEAFSWDFFHFDKTHSRIHIELSSAHTQADVFQQLTHLRLEQHRITSPIETVTLRSNGLRQADVRTGTLFQECVRHSDSAQEAQSLIDTLKARLGTKSLHQLQALDDHLPEARQGFAQLSHSPLSTTPLAVQATDRQLPLWLLPNPQPLPDIRRHHMELLSNAQRIDSHWWQQHQQRDYFTVRDSHGCHWIFFDQIQKRWFLHGHYGY